MKIFTKFAVSCIAAALLGMGAFALDAEVTSVTGKVEVQKGENWVALSVGDKISTGSVVSTGFKSEVTMKVNGSTFTLGPLTRMTVEKMLASADADNTQLYIDSGSVSAQVNHGEERRVGFKVSSPVATASVRGTDFTATAAGNVTTREGLVSKGPAESNAPQVTSGEANEGTFVPAEGESTPQTSTQDVGGNYGVPVYAGQSSSTDSVTGAARAPQAEQQSAATELQGSTGSLASRESTSTTLVSAPVTAATTPASSGSGQAAMGKLVITVTVPPLSE